MISNTKADDKEYVVGTYARFDLEIVRGQGSLLYDGNGKEYIDLNSGIAVNTFGTADPEWVAAVTAQAGKLQHTSNLYYSEPCTALAKLLCERTGAKRVFFGNSGAEANECAIKTARKWAKDNKGDGFYNIITLKNSFHGRTVTTLAATGQDSFHTVFDPFTEGFIYAQANDIESITNAVKNNKCCAIMFELVQGEGGVLPLTHEFVDAMAALARENDLLLIADEVQTGNGRTGSLYAYQQFGFTPDILTTAKGLAGGLPLGATLMFDKTQDTLTAGSHGSTFGGNPVACAGAISILSRIDDALLRDVRSKSQYIKLALAGAKGIRSVSGMGLMLGVETEKPVEEIIARCMERGILPIKAKNKMRLLPPLNISPEHLKQALQIILEVAEESVKG